MSSRNRSRHVALLALLAGTPAFAGDDAHREHGAHVHGVGWLDVALDGATLEVSFKGTGADVAGLEGEPADAADVGKVAVARRALGDATKLFAFEPAGACSLDGAADVRPPASALAAPGADHEHDHEHDHDHDHDHEHADGDAHDHEADAGHAHGDWEASWRFRCTGAPQAVRFEGFAAFASLEQVRVQVLGPAGQTAVELTPSARRIPLAAD